MAIQRRDETVLLATGQAISGAAVYYLTQPANLTTLTPLANVYADALGTVAANPQITDGFGHAVAYLSNAQPYTVVYVSPYIGQIVYTDQIVGSAGGGSSTGTPFAETPTGVVNGSNTAFTLSFVPLGSTLVLTVNGLQVNPGLGYIIAGKNITMAAAPQIGDLLYASYSY